MSTMEVARIIKNMLVEKNIKYCFDSAGNIIVFGRDGADYIVINVLNPQVCGDVLCGILSVFEQDEELCYNLDDVINILKKKPGKIII